MAPGDLVAGGWTVLGSLKQFYLKRRLGPPIVVVSGLPRSGTSMMMKMLVAGGCELVTDNQRTADEDNPEGYFELERVKDLDKEGDSSWLAAYKGKAVKIISSLLPDLPDDYFYKVIFMRRNLFEVIASQNKMLVRRDETDKRGDDEKMIANYKFHLRKIDYILEDRPVFEALDVDHRETINDPLAQAERVAGFLGLKLDTARMAEAVNPKLYRNRQPD